MKNRQSNLESYGDLLLSFEQAWSMFKLTDATHKTTEGAATPSVSRFASTVNTCPESVLIELRLELTKIDLEHRLRFGLPILTPEYQETLGQIPLDAALEDLLRYEFQLRQKFDCRPTLGELRTRFGTRHQHFATLLPNETTASATATTKLADDESVGGKQTSIAQLVTPGCTIGKYRIERQIGSGSFSLVYGATDQSLQRPAAIKFLRPHISRD